MLTTKEYESNRQQCKLVAVAATKNRQQQEELQQQRQTQWSVRPIRLQSLTFLIACTQVYFALLLPLLLLFKLSVRWVMVFGSSFLAILVASAIIFWFFGCVIYCLLWLLGLLPLVSLLLLLFCCVFCCSTVCCLFCGHHSVSTLPHNAHLFCIFFTTFFFTFFMLYFVLIFRLPFFAYLHGNWRRCPNHSLRVHHHQHFCPSFAVRCHCSTWHNNIAA